MGIQNMQYFGFVELYVDLETVMRDQRMDADITVLSAKRNETN